MTMRQSRKVRLLWGCRGSSGPFRLDLCSHNPVTIDVTSIGWVCSSGWEVMMAMVMVFSPPVAPVSFMAISSTNTPEPLDSMFLTVPARDISEPELIKRGLIRRHFVFENASCDSMSEFSGILLVPFQTRHTLLLIVTLSMTKPERAVFLFGRIAILTTFAVAMTGALDNLISR